MLLGSIWEPATSFYMDYKSQIDRNSIRKKCLLLKVNTIAMFFLLE